MQPIFRTRGSEVVVTIPARGTDPSWLTRPLDEMGFPACSGIKTFHLEIPRDCRWGVVDAALLARVLHALGAVSADLMLVGLPPGLEKLLMLAHVSPHASNAVTTAVPGILARIGLRTGQHARELRAFVALLGKVVLLLPRFAMGRAKVRGADVIEVLAESSSRAFGIVAVVNMLMGAILAFVGAVQLTRFGAGIYVADLVGIACVRELTPIITAIVLAGRTGASFAARIATMHGNEEIDALTTLGLQPAEYLVLPRVAALTLLMPLLYIYGCAFAIMGGLWVSGPILNLSAASYASELQQAVLAANFAIGGLKAAVFGALVALLGCHYALRSDRSAAGVGSATTSAVVSSIIGIIALDAVFAVCANALDV